MLHLFRDPFEIIGHAPNAKLINLLNLMLDPFEGQPTNTKFM